MIRIQLRHLPNVITCIRFILITPILCALLKNHYPLAFYLFLIAGLSDGLDGFLARFFGWTSYLGALLDPIADKLLLMGSFVVLAYLQQVPFWLAAFVVGRDICIMGGALAYRYWAGPLSCRPAWISKLNTFFQLVLVTLLIVKLAFFSLPEPVIPWLTTAVFLTTLLSFIRYAWVWAKQATHYVRIGCTNRRKKEKTGVAIT